MQSSCSLQHVPIDTGRETKLPATLMPKLAFAIQKLAELKAVATGKAPVASSVKVESKAPNLDKSLFDRPAVYADRRNKQFEAHPNVCDTIHPAPQCLHVLSSCFEHYFQHATLVHFLSTTTPPVVIFSRLLQQSIES